LLLCAGGGLVLVATVLPWHGVTAGVAALVIAGAALVGVAYGGLQSLTLVQAFERAGQSNSRLASAVWNIGFDSGTGLGSTVVGALATWYSYPAALVVIAVVCGLAAVGTLAPRRRPTPQAKARSWGHEPCGAPARGACLRGGRRRRPADRAGAVALRAGWPAGRPAGDDGAAQTAAAGA